MIPNAGVADRRVDTSIGGMVICDSAEQARELFRQFQHHVIGPVAADREPANDAMYQRAAEAPGAYAKQPLKAALILYDEGSKQSREDEIDLNNRINAELEALVKTIYDYWFVQFDFPDAHGRPYKSSGGAMVWNDALKREIPAGWEAVAIGQECETILGGTPHTKNPGYWDYADIPWLSSGETASFPVVASEQKITAAGVRDSAAKVLPAGTAVVSIVRYIRPSILGIAAATNQSVAGILETAQFPSSFLYPAVCSEVPRLMALRTGAQQPHINKATIDDTLLVKPSKGVIDAYRKVADPLFKRILVAAYAPTALDAHAALRHAGPSRTPIAIAPPCRKPTTPALSSLPRSSSGPTRTRLK